METVKGITMHQGSVQVVQSEIDRGSRCKTSNDFDDLILVIYLRRLPPRLVQLFSQRTRALPLLSLLVQDGRTGHQGAMCDICRRSSRT